LCWKELEDSYYQEIGADGIPRVRRFGPNKQKIDNVVRGLTAKFGSLTPRYPSGSEEGRDRIRGV